MESDYLAGLMGRGDLSSGYAYFTPTVQQGSGAIMSSDVSVAGVGTGQASLSLAGVLVVVLMLAYVGTRGRQH